MTDRTLMSTLRFRRNTSAGWAGSNPTLGSGEPGYEKDTGRLKVGDGLTRWNDLDYFLPDEVILALIQEILDQQDSGGVSAVHQELLAHIQSLTPHPVYDDGPSLLLLYQNAKV